MRNRILIVVLGVSLGLIAKIGVSLYEDWRRASNKPAPAGAPEKSGKQTVAPAK